MNKSNKHDMALCQMVDEPDIIGILFPENARMEVPMFIGSRQYGAIDIVVNALNGIYVVEYKCNETERSRAKAQKQLMVAHEWYKKTAGIFPDHLLFVYGDQPYGVEELMRLSEWKPIQ